MGWTVDPGRPKGVSNLDYFTAEGMFNNTTHVVLDNATVGGTFYAALQTETGKVVGVVITTKRYRTTGGGTEFGYKDMDEFMGPNESKCPDRILDLLSPLGEPDGFGQTFAAEWRAKSRRYNEVKRLVRKGTTIKLPTPLKFNDGVERDEFIYQGRGNSFLDAATKQRVSLIGWADRKFEVVA